MSRRLPVITLLFTLLLSVACTNKKVKNPIAQVDSKQPDKVLFDNAMDALKHNRFEVARLTLQTMINTYPDSEFIARAKLGVADSWYAEGGSGPLTQAEIEYNDFITFFPNMPEAAEAQLKIANIHFQQMEKSDRDFTHAMRAEKEYRNLITQWPDSKLVPDAKQKLMEVQEILADREFGIGRFYYLRQSYPAGIARLRTLVDRYPLYSQADEALFLLGQSYEDEITLMQKQKIPDSSPMYKGRQELMESFTAKATEAYSRILTRYPLMPWAADAKERLEAMHKPVPRPTKAMVAQNKKEMESRSEASAMTKVMGAFRRHPITAQAAKVGEPPLVDPPSMSATDVVKQANKAYAAGNAVGNSKLSIETVGTGAPPPNEAAPRSDAPPAQGGDDANPPAETAGGTVPPAAAPAQAPAHTAADANELVPNVSSDPNELKPNVAGADAPAPAPAQVNQMNEPGASVTAANGQEELADDSVFSSSKHKKKKGLKKIVPF